MIGVERILQVLVYLAAVIGVMPLLPYLAGWLLMLLGAGFILGILGDLKGRYLLHNHLATLLSLGFFILFISQASLANLVNPLVHFLCALLAVRLASDKSARHILQLFLLATIVLAASSLLTLDVGYLFYLVLIVLLLTSGLVLLSFYQTEPVIRFSRRQWQLLLKSIAVLPAGSLVLMLVLFVILPRTQTPLWNFLNPRPTAMIGMSDQVRPGSVAELAASGQIAFRAETAQLPVTALYWRAIVFNRLEGRAWHRAEKIAQESLLAAPASAVELRIYSEPKADRYLVSLDRPLELGGIRNRQAPDGVITGRIHDSRKVNYRVQAQYSALSRQEGEVDVYLQLPDDFPPRLKQVAAQVGAGQNYPERIARLDAFFLEQQLSYSNRQLPQTANPLETFLFDSRRGYCEYFASAYAVLLRMAGVPARLVGGYLGGEYNRLGGYYLVGEDSAHVWVEALDDTGLWRRIDPSRLAVNAEQALAVSGTQGMTLQGLADAVLHNWSRFVLNYDLREQFSLVRSVFGKIRDLKSLDRDSARQVLWLWPVLVLGVAGYLLRQRRSLNQRLVKKYRSILAKMAGVEAFSDSLGIYQLARLSAVTRCTEFAEIYGGAVYRDRALSKAEAERLKQILKELKRYSRRNAVAFPDALGDNDISNRFDDLRGGIHAVHTSQYDQGRDRRTKGSAD